MFETCLRDLHQYFQIPVLVKLRVPMSSDWAYACLPDEVSVYEKTLEASLCFLILLFVLQLLTHLRLAPGWIMPNR